MLTSGSPTTFVQEVLSRTPQPPPYYANNKCEEISCRAIAPLYDRSKEQLFPFLSRLDLHHQNEGWASATYLTIDNKQNDLTLHVSVITEYDVITHTHA
jgi:hypothetical protein